MSVIEFFSTYWDWYLSAGVLVSFVYCYICDKPVRHGRIGRMFGAVLLIFMWPVPILEQYFKG